MSRVDAMSRADAMSAPRTAPRIIRLALAAASAFTASTLVASTFVASTFVASTFVASTFVAPTTTHAQPPEPTPTPAVPTPAVPTPAVPTPEGGEPPTPNEGALEPAVPSATPNEATPDPAAAAQAPNEPGVGGANPPTSPPSEPPDAPPPSTLPGDRQPVIQVALSPEDGLMTGDVLTLTLRVTTPARDDVTIPRGQRFAPFEVLRRPTPRVEVQGDRATHVFELELLALEPGDHELPPVTLRVVTADGVVGEVSTAPLRVQVGSVLGNEPNAEPKPPTDPVEVWQDDYTLAWLLGGVGLVLLGALLSWFFLRWWRRRPKAATPPPPPRPAWEVALEKLEALRRDRNAAVHEERVVAWVDQVSDALREYLGRRYDFDGLESTTDEVVAELRKRKLIGLSLDEVIALLRDCDLVKFAQAELGVEQSDLLLAGAFRVVRTTAPLGGTSGTGLVESGGAVAGSDRTRPPAPPVAPSGDARWMGPVTETRTFASVEPSTPRQPAPMPATRPAEPSSPAAVLATSVEPSTPRQPAPMPATRPAEASPLASVLASSGEPMRPIPNTLSPAGAPTRQPQTGVATLPGFAEVGAPERGELGVPERGEAGAPARRESEGPARGEAGAPERGEAGAPERGALRDDDPEGEERS